MSNSTLVLQEKKLFLLEGGWPITFTSDQSLSVIFLTYFCLIRQYIKMKKSNYEQGWIVAVLQAGPNIDHVYSSVLTCVHQRISSGLILRYALYFVFWVTPSSPSQDVSITSLQVPIMNIKREGVKGERRGSCYKCCVGDSLHGTQLCLCAKNFLSYWSIVKINLILFH